jgi:hypothetical protein
MLLLVSLVCAAAGCTSQIATIAIYPSEQYTFV